MKETKVWIDGEFPQVYFDPKTGNESIEGRPFILEDIKTHDRELVKEVCDKIIKFINELAWKDIQYDAFQSTIGEFSGSTSAIPRYAKKYFDLWKEMFGVDLNEVQKEIL